MTHQIIDNYLSDKIFKDLQTSIVWNHTFPWYFCTTVSGVEEEIDAYYGTHMIYDKGKPLSNFYNKLVPIVNLLPNFRALIRIKANFYPRTESIYEHGSHTDYDFKHNGAILYLNTCDGFTRLENNIKINSIENRLLLFDSSRKHNSSTTTNKSGRFNININYL